MDNIDYSFKSLVNRLKQVDDYEAENILRQEFNRVYNLGLKQKGEHPILFLLVNGLEGMIGELYLPRYTQLKDINWNKVEIKEGAPVTGNTVRVVTDQAYNLVVVPKYATPYKIEGVRFYMDQFFVEI